MRRGDYRNRVAARQQRLHNAQGDCAEQTKDEEIGGNQEDAARLADAAQIDYGDRQQNEQAERQGVRLREGTAEIKAPTPAEMPTAAVRM